MPAPQPSPDGFVSLWPTLLMRRTLPGHEHANVALERLIDELQAANPRLTTDYRARDVLAMPHPGSQWLRQCVDVSVRDYLRHQGVDYPVRWHSHGWVNVNSLGDYHDPHNHPHAYLSGTYYARVPRGRATQDNRDDVRPGCITLYDPRGAVNMTAIRGDANVEPEYTVDPEAGLMLLWPAFLMHFVHPNLAPQARLSISFNVMLENPRQHLPEQP